MTAAREFAVVAGAAVFVLTLFLAGFLMLISFVMSMTAGNLPMAAASVAGAFCAGLALVLFGALLHQWSFNQ